MIKAFVSAIILIQIKYILIKNNFTLPIIIKIEKYYDKM